jgi:hypothetical protein
MLKLAMLAGAEAEALEEMDSLGKDFSDQTHTSIIKGQFIQFLSF